MSLVKIERRDHMTWIVMNRPEKGNALNRELMRELIKSVDEADRDSSSRIIILTGEGRHFSTGVDLSEIASLSRIEEVEDIFKTLADLFKRLIDLSKPLIIAYNGDAYGGGAEMIWLGDIIISVEDARFGWVESRWGLIPPLLSGIGSLVIGFARAHFIALSSGVLTAREAYQLGLISHLTTRERLREDIERIARNILENSSPEALSSIKRVARSVKTSILVDLGVSELMRLSRSEDVIRRARDFIEKKQMPRYI
ncbi:MAG: enoyl-CoA hydratase/isomerase family protein [Sulfolobales archaeon]